MSNSLFERTLVILKPDVVQRQIVGEILHRFERKGYKIVAMKLALASKELIGNHYPYDETYLKEVGSKAKQDAVERGEEFGFASELACGEQIREWNIEYLSCGPVLAFVVYGHNVIEGVRTLVGKTNPIRADIGTIRSDFTTDSYILADTQGRTTRTMIHASDSVENAEREIALWFKEDEIFEYETAIEKILYDTDWSKKH